jgi:CubicO group peptidase (beta-lactamase class C family)
MRGVRAVGIAAQTPAWQDVDRLFRAYADSDKAVGASFLFMKDGRVVQRDDYGYADRTVGKKIDPESIYHWGSITKTLTAISIMQLRDRGRLSLDDHITKYVPELRAMHDPYNMMDSITIRMLLSHTAGFQNPTWTYGSGEPWEPFEPTTWNQLVAMMPYQQLNFKPGSRYSYSNPGFIYLARVIEQLTGDPWESYVQKNIFAPLNMDHSYFRTTPYYLAAQRSHNYYIDKDSSSSAVKVIDNGTDFDPGITTPNGGWNAPFSDLVKYLTFLTNAPGPSSANYDVVLKRSSLAEMWTPIAPMSQGYEAAPDESIGLSFFIVKRGNTTLYGHTGSQAGFHTFIFFNPQNGAAVIAAFNTTNYVSPATAAKRRFQEAAQDLLK